MRLKWLLVTGALCAFSLSAADKPAPTATNALLGNLNMVEREVVSLVEAMPEDKFQFAPTAGSFEGVRTFAQQATHVATVNYMVCATLLGEKSPFEAGEGENGPATMKTKADIVKYLKDSFAYAHKAMGTLNDGNLNELVPSAFGGGKSPRVEAATIPVWHTFDHYGQMVIYARMNGVVPPASRK